MCHSAIEILIMAQKGNTHLNSYLKLSAKVPDKCTERVQSFHYSDKLSISSVFLVPSLLTWKTFNTKIFYLLTLNMYFVVRAYFPAGKFYS